MPKPSKLRGAWRLVRLLVHVLRGWLTIRRRFRAWSQAQRNQAVQQWSQGMLDVLGLQLRIEGQLLRQGPLMLVCNHISWLDIAVLHAAVHCRFISKDDIRDWPMLGTLASGGGTLYISRASRRDALRVVHQMAQALQQGDVLAFFPEGTTGDGSTVLPFHANLLQAAITAEAPVQALGLRFEDAASSVPSFAPCYVGDESLLDSAWRTVCAPPLRAVLRCAPAQNAQGRDRRALASDLREIVIDLRAGSL